MDLKNQVCSLELAKRLKELGVKQESLWWWRDGAGVCLRCTLYPAQFDTQDVYQAYAAFTVAELGEMLPFDPRDDQDDIVPHVNDNKKRHGKWTITYYAEGVYHEMAPSEADARAAMLIYLLENGLLK